MRLQRPLCWLLGHEWRKRPVQSVFDQDAIVGVCERCGDEAKAMDAMTFGGRNVPSDLIKQDDVDMVKAMYREGRLSEEEFETAVGAAMGDPEAAEALKEMEECD